MIKSAAITGVILVTLGLAWWTDPWPLFIFTILPLLWIGFPTAIVAGIALWIASFTNRSKRVSINTLKVVAAFAVFVAVVLPTNTLFQNWAASAAKSYPAKIGPLLESYKKAHGIYPATLEALSNKPSIPRLLKTRYGYSSDGSKYSFMFPEPGGVMDVWIYDSESRTWTFSS